MDQWVQRLSLGVLLVVVGLCLYGTNREISCVTPAHFTTDHSKYTHHVCSKPDAVIYPVEGNPLEERENLTLWTSHVDTRSAWLLKLVLVEVIVVCTAYCLIDWIVTAGGVDARFSHKELHKSYIKVPLYFLIQLVCAICWVAFTIVSNRVKDFPTGQSAFLCDYQFRRPGNTFRYTVQCIDDHDHITQAAYMINFGLALVVTLTKISHIVSALVIGPLVGVKSARVALVQSGIINNPWQLGVLQFALSDLYFAMLVGEKGDGSPLQRPHVGLVEAKGEQGGRSQGIGFERLVESE